MALANMAEQLETNAPFQKHKKLIKANVGLIPAMLASPFVGLPL
jgi:hypothetical protein